MKRMHITIGLSGGVDSSVAAWFLKKQGHKVDAIFMKNWDDETSGACNSKEDFLSAAVAAEKLDIPLEHVSFSEEYKKAVFNDFLKEYANGKTPNPDVFCNSEIKFKAFLNYSKKLGSEMIATGHYAQSQRAKNKQYNLIKALDCKKDQTYFLYRLSQKQLAGAMFPIGHLVKGQVRKIAKELDLPNADRKDSMGICFIGNGQFKSFISKYIKPKPGYICDEAGEVIGEHQGLHYYTVGQRKGLGIGGRKLHNSNNDFSGEPWFVVKKDLKENRLIVVQGSKHPSLYVKIINAGALHWISGCEPQIGEILQIKIRHGELQVNAKVLSCDKVLSVEPELPVWGVAPGQSLVLYQGNICLGGGIIT